VSTLPPLTLHVIRGTEFRVTRRDLLRASTLGFDPTEERADVIGFRTFRPARQKHPAP
jgi:hypothetical protein